MKSILIVIRTQWVNKIVSGKKTIEVRKSAPKEVPFKAYIYCCKAKSQWSLCDYEGAYANSQGEIVYAQQHIIGEFICDKIDDFYCASVPYQRENNLGYGRFIDNGVYKVNGWHEGIVFERNDRYINTMLNNNDLKEMCLSAQELFDYIGVGKHLYAWHISDLKIYDEPRKLSEFYTIDKSGDDCCIACVYHETPVEEMPCKTCTGERRYLYRPPQSWQYIEEVEQ